MEQKKYFFAVDLGATSGRTILGSLADGKFELEELTRFDNRLIETGNHFYWDIFALFYEIIAGLKLVAQRSIHIESIGIDTWGCDFVYVDNNGDILRNTPAVQKLLEILSSPIFHREVGEFSGNDYRDLGKMMVEV